MNAQAFETFMDAHLHRRDRAAEFGSDLGLRSPCEVEAEDGLAAAGAQARECLVEVLASLDPHRFMVGVMRSKLHGGLLFVPAAACNRPLLIQHHTVGGGDQPSTQAVTAHRAGPPSQKPSTLGSCPPNAAMSGSS